MPGNTAERYEFKPGRFSSHGRILRLAAEWPRTSRILEVGTASGYVGRELRALGFGEALASGSLDYQLVKLVVEWKAPAHYDQVLELSVHATRLGNTSFTLATEFRIAARPEIIVTAETVNVVVEAHTLRKTPLPPDFRAALERGAAGVITDHAAYLASAGSVK